MSKVIEAAAKPLEKLPLHPLASQYESKMGAADLKKFAEQIGRENLRLDVVLLEHDGRKKILTHRNYYNACKEYHIPVETREFGSDPDDGPDPAAFVARAHSQQAPGTEPVTPVPEPAEPPEAEAEIEEAEVSEAEVPAAQQPKSYIELCIENAEKQWADAQEAEDCKLAEGRKETGAEEAETEDSEGAGEKAEKRAQVDHLIALVKVENVRPFVDSKNEPYARMSVNGHIEVWPMRPEKDDTFSRKIGHLYKQTVGRAINAQYRKEAIDNLIEDAYDAPVEEVYVRFAPYGDNLYIDMGDKDWRVVKITKSGYSVIERSPVAFIRPPGLKPLPEPQSGGNIGMLRDFLHVDDAGFVMALAWTIGTFHPTGPYPALFISGAAGSGKSTLVETLRSLLDPNVVMLRGSPGSDEVIFIQAQNSWIMAYDNLSHVDTNTSDVLCRLLTGTGYGKRRLFTDGKEELYNTKRPVILTSIAQLVSRDDLLDRGMALELKRVSAYRSDAKLREDFEQVRPLILGAIYSAVSAALAGYKDRQAETSQYRMCDFVQWVATAEPALGLKPGTFAEVYEQSRRDTNECILENSLVAQALKRFIRRTDETTLEARKKLAQAGTQAGASRWKGPGEWEGTMQELLSSLNKPKYSGLDDLNRRDWPGTPRRLRNHLNRIETALLKGEGIQITYHVSHGKHLVKIVALSVESQADETLAA